MWKKQHAGFYKTIRQGQRAPENQSVPETPAMKRAAEKAFARPPRKGESGAATKTPAMSRNKENTNMTTHTTKLGPTSTGERRRIWIEGARLSEAGFKVGRFFQKSWGRGQLVLTLCTAKQYEKASRDVRGKVSGKEDKPIIDVTGEAVAKFFHGTHVDVNFTKHKITISNNA